MQKLEGAKYWRLFSDIHEDMYVQKHFKPSQLWMPDPLPEDKESVLVLAGDLWHAKKYLMFSGYSWLKDVASRFKYVVVVLGNHDFWGGKYPDEYVRFETYKQKLGIDNLFLLQDSTLLIGDVKFVGATLWNNLDGRNPEVLEEYNSSINDVRYIRWSHPVYPNSFKKWGAKQVIEAYSKSKQYIFENAKKDYPEQKVFVVTHHPPVTDLFSVPEEYPYYVDLESHKKLYGNNLGKEIAESEIDVWVYGHNHQSGHVKIGNTDIYSNTVGYPLSSAHNEVMNPDYNPWFQEEFHGLKNSLKPSFKLK